VSAKEELRQAPTSKVQGFFVVSTLLIDRPSISYGGAAPYINILMKYPPLQKIHNVMDWHEYRYHVLPHHGLVNDWYEAYKELEEAVRDYFGMERSSLE
tara:strand:- start:1894 stop:2190 length:297 start_codon:yes stop_codon:yes gene_type:complete